MAEYIDKQKLIEELDDKYSLGDIGRMEHDIIVNALLYAKPADVRPVVRGEWTHLGGDEWCCDQCGHVIFTEGSWEHPLNDRSIFFCEHCGADMRGGDDE